MPNSGYTHEEWSLDRVAQQVIRDMVRVGHTRGQFRATRRYLSAQVGLNAGEVRRFMRDCRQVAELELNAEEVA